MNPWTRSVIASTACPKCHCGPTHWCRDEKGKCVSPHSERTRAALGLKLDAYAFFLQRPDKAEGGLVLPERAPRTATPGVLSLAAAAGKGGGA